MEVNRGHNRKVFQTDYTFSDDTEGEGDCDRV